VAQEQGRSGARSGRSGQVLGQVEAVRSTVRSGQVVDEPAETVASNEEPGVGQVDGQLTSPPDRFSAP